jgi:hypothetical protein
MKNVTCVGLCWAMTLGLVAVALGQQQPVTRLQEPPRTIDSSRMPVPAAPERSVMTGRYQPAAPGMNEGQRRGELGVWMGESGGPGVRVLRVASGSAAEKSGLRVGDIILQVNGRGATTPQDTANLIRQIPIGGTGNLTVWRDGNQQQIQVTVQPIREAAREIVSEGSHQAGFGLSNSTDSELASRTMRLEQQITSLTRELASLRQELAQLRTSGPLQAGFSAEASQGAPPQEPPVQYNQTTSPPPGFAPSEEAPARPAAEAATPATPAPPAAEKPPANDLFGSGAAEPKSEEKPKPEAQPKTEEKPKADEKGGTDDLFK